MSFHLDTLFWFRANQFFLFVLNAVCLATDVVSTSTDNLTVANWVCWQHILWSSICNWCTQICFVLYFWLLLLESIVDLIQTVANWVDWWHICNHQISIDVVIFFFFLFGYPVKVIWFSCSQKLLKFFGLSNILTECTRWRFSLKHVMHTKLNIYVFITSNTW